jgi:hypothetical protein
VARAAHDDALRPERVTERVTRETLLDGRVVALKRASPGAPVKREADILRYLYKRGCAVPEVISAGEDELVTLWCGHETLDDALQAGRPVSGAALAEAVRKVSLVLSRVAPIPPIAKDALAAQLKPWAEALPEAWSWLLGAAPPKRLLDETIAYAVACEPAAGSLDYTARNVLVDESGQRVWLIDFAATGFDWTERRLAQYALGAGGGRVEGVFRSALTIGAYLSESDPAATDAHEVVLLLTAAEHLREVEAGTAHEERQTAWRNVEQRKASLIELLRRPLAGHGPAARLRAALR